MVLVNARDQKAPLDPQAVAQANLDGGGKQERQMPRSPLPDAGHFASGDVLAASQRRVESLEREQHGGGQRSDHADTAVDMQAGMAGACAGTG